MWDTDMFFILGWVYIYRATHPFLEDTRIARIVPMYYYVGVYIGGNYPKNYV